MAELKLDIVFGNLNRVKKSLENITLGGSGTNNNQKSGINNTLVGGFAFLGGFLGGILAQLDVVRGLLGILNGLINSLVAPFVPLLLGLFKPVFILLNIVLKKLLQSLTGEGGGLGIFALITGALAGLAIILTGGGILIAVAIAGVVAAINAISFDKVKNVGERARVSLDTALSKVSDFYDNVIVNQTQKLLPSIQKLEDIFGVELTDSFLTIAVNIKRFKDGIEEVIDGFLSLDREKIINGFTTAFDSFANIIGATGTFFGNLLEGIFKSLIQSLVNIFNNVLNFIGRVFNGFVNGLVDVVNSVINLINRFLGGKVVANVRNPGKVANTEININIEGSADQKTVEALTNKLRSELARRGAF